MYEMNDIRKKKVLCRINMLYRMVSEDNNKIFKKYIYIRIARSHFAMLKNNDFEEMPRLREYNINIIEE